ncbi:MAG: hypothetical protein MJ060_00960 [Clostridia bacterium]|nr:hypothetical protein [Clostridia bacterium]
MKLIQIAFTKLRDYFTANTGRKIFFFGMIAATLNLLLYAFLPYMFFYIFALLSLLGAFIGSLWDSMYTRYLFLKKVRDIQYDHLKEISDRQTAGEDVVMTPTFSSEEKRYLRRRKWWFVLIILFKVGLVIALFSLLLHI